MSDTLAASGAASRLPPRFDPATLPDIDDPYPLYATLRRAPVCRGGPAQVVVARYDDVARLLRDGRLSNRFPPEYHQLARGGGAASAFLERILLHRDPPEHQRLRQLMGQAFAPAAIRRLRSDVGRLAGRVLEPLLEAGELDVVTDLAFMLPIMVICQLTGIPAEDTDQVRSRAFDLGKTFVLSTTADDRAAADRAVEWLRDYVSGLVAERRRHPRQDLVSEVVQASDADPRLTEEEIVDNLVFLFFAGFETTTNMIATGCAALFDHPHELARLRRDPGLLATACDEFVRYDAPIQSRARLVVEPVEIGGRIVRPGRVVVLLVGSANRDERQFDHPDRLDVGRHPNPHLGFGTGRHHCVGAALARLEGHVVFELLLRRCAMFEPAGPPVRQLGGAFRGFSSLPVAVTPA